MNTECFRYGSQYIIVAVTDNYSIETYAPDDKETTDLIKSRLTENRGYHSYVVYKWEKWKYHDIERWTARNGKEVN